MQNSSERADGRKTKLIFVVNIVHIEWYFLSLLLLLLLYCCCYYYSQHIVDCHVKECKGKSKFASPYIAIKAIQTTLGTEGGRDHIVKSIGRKKGRKCVKAHLTFRTGTDRDGQALYGCKLIITGKGWIVSAYPV